MSTQRACPKCGAALTMPAASTSRLVRVDCSTCGAIVAVRLEDEAPRSAEATATALPPAPPPRANVVMATSADVDEELPRRSLWPVTLLAIVAVVVVAIILYSKFAGGATP